MFLTRTTDQLIILPDSTQEVDVYACWSDRQRVVSGAGVGNDEGDSSLTAITSGSATVIIPATKPRGVVRVVDYLGVKAPKSNVAPVTPRVQLSNGTTLIDLFSAPLNPGDQYFYFHGGVWTFIPASGLAAGSADLVQQFIDALTNQSPNLPS